MKQIAIALKNSKYAKKISFNFQSGFFMQLRYILSTPFIYGMIVPMILFHIVIEIYHRVVFYLYGIKYVDYKDFFIFKRHSFDNLSPIQKINCIYCEYGNALAAYVKEIIAKTELYWCPIKNGRKENNTHRYYNNFMNENDTHNFENNRKNLRKGI